MTRLEVPRSIIDQTFAHFRECGEGRRECQALWVGPWSHPHRVTQVVHPSHKASPVGFEVDEEWLQAFWLWLAEHDLGIRIQCHTHPGAAYHSSTDDDFPILRTPGFLSLVIPRFATGPVGFDRAFLAQLNDADEWHEVSIAKKLEIVS